MANPAASTANVATPGTKTDHQVLNAVPVKELNPPEIRWFYKLSKESKWVPFRGRDSLLIELKWRINKEVPLGDDFPGREEALKLCQNSIVVMDGFFEVIFGDEIKVKPIYWKGETMKLIRGTWFYENEWLPVNPKLAHVVEEQHVKIFTGNKAENVPNDKVTKAGTVSMEKVKQQIVHCVDQDKCRILWMSSKDVSMEITNRSWAMCLRLKTNILKLHRCYHTAATFSDGALPINKLIFVVHGIGQMRHVDKIIADTDRIRQYAERMLNESFKHIKYRPMFLPIEWRTSLKLDEGIVETITPKKLQFLRALLNSTVLDIMYYSSPKYRSEVMDGMIAVLNRVYELFTFHNPHFENINGEISIIAHSLGSVICYDVITGWSPLQQYEEYVTNRLKHAIGSPFISQESKEHLSVLENVRQQLEENEGGLLKVLLTADVSSMHLAFQVQHLFCLGSPLSLFLALRGQVGQKVFEHKHLILYNIFHPNDPVAYRIEPLVHSLYAKLRPLRIYRHDELAQQPYEKLPMEVTKKYRKSRSKNKSNLTQNSSKFSKENTPFNAVKSPPISKKTDSLNDSSASQGALSEFDLSEIPQNCRLPYRMDYALKEWAFDYIALSAVTAHVNYWTDPDVTMFILKQLYAKKCSQII